jgi:hypothetical protein
VDAAWWLQSIYACNPGVLEFAGSLLHGEFNLEFVPLYSELCGNIPHKQ